MQHPRTLWDIRNEHSVGLVSLESAFRFLDRSWGILNISNKCQNYKLIMNAKFIRETFPKVKFAFLSNYNHRRSAKHLTKVLHHYSRDFQSMTSYLQWRIIATGTSRTSSIIKSTISSYPVTPSSTRWSLSSSSTGLKFTSTTSRMRRVK